MNNKESRLQQACITWLRLQYPKIYKLLFSVPNCLIKQLSNNKLYYHEEKKFSSIDAFNSICRKLNILL